MPSIVTQEKKRLQKHYHTEFLKYANDNRIEITTENLMIWDKTENRSQLEKHLIDYYGRQGIYDAGLKELFTRYLYNFSLVFKPLQGLPKPATPRKPFTSIQKGIDTTKMREEDRQNLVDIQMEKVKEAMRRLRMYQLPLKQIKAAILRALEEVCSEE